ASGVMAGALTIGVFPPVIIMIMVHTGYLRPVVLLTYLFFLGSAFVGLGDGVASNTMMMLTLSLLFSGLVGERGGAVFFLVLETIMIVVAAALQSRGIIAQAHPLSANELSIRTLLDIAMLCSVAFVSIIAAGELRRALSYGARLIAQLRATAEVAQRTATL